MISFGDVDRLTEIANENLVKANHVNRIYDETKEIIEKLIADREDTKNKS